MTPQSNTFFGQKVSQPGVNVNHATDNQLLYKNDYSSQTFYGTNGNITFGAFTSSITGNQVQGQQIVDSSGNVTFEQDGQTQYWFDGNGYNIMQVGLLPDGTYGWVVATPGTNVADSY